MSRRVSENNNENILIYVTFGSSISDKMYNYIRARAEFEVFQNMMTARLDRAFLR